MIWFTPCIFCYFQGLVGLPGRNGFPVFTLSTVWQYEDHYRGFFAKLALTFMDIFHTILLRFYVKMSLQFLDSQAKFWIKSMEPRVSSQSCTHFWVVFQGLTVQDSLRVMYIRFPLLFYEWERANIITTVPILCVYIHFSCVIIISINGIIRFRHANSCNRYVLHFIYFALRCPYLGHLSSVIAYASVHSVFVN